MVRPRLVVAAVLVVLAAAGCAATERPRGAAINDPGTQPSTTPNALPSGPAAPLVGLASSEAIAGRRAVAVPIQVKLSGLAPVGLDMADLLFMEYAEDTSLRFTAVYQSREAARIGPVTEIRPTDIRSVTVLNTFVGHGGGTTGFLQQLKASGLPSVSRVDRGDLFPNGYTSTAALYRSMPAGAVAPPGVFAFAGPGEPLSDQGTRPASKLSVNVPGHSGGTWTYDPESRSWASEINKTVLRAASIVVLKMPYRQLSVNNPSPRELPSAEVFGAGTATVVSGPAAVDGKWAKTGMRQVCNISGADGFLLRLQPGAAWVIYAPSNATVSVT